MYGRITRPAVPASAGGHRRESTVGGDSLRFVFSMDCDLHCVSSHHPSHYPEKVSLRAMAHRCNTDGAPTPRGKGRRPEATIGKRRTAQKE
jgi:hypothetical protein